MISYEALQDAVTALIIIIIISVIIALAWLSTNVREQPLVAFVVFHSANNNNTNNSGNNNNNNGERERVDSAEEIHTSESSSSSSPSSSSSSSTTVEAKTHSIDTQPSPSLSSSLSSSLSVNIGSINQRKMSMEGENCKGDGVVVREVDRVDREIDRREDREGTKEEREGRREGKEGRKEENEGREERRDDREGSKEWREEKEGGRESKEGRKDNEGREERKETEADRNITETGDMGQADNSRPQGHADPSLDMEARKRRLQQFISMGETATTKHLEKLSEQLAASLTPSEETEASAGHSNPPVSLETGKDGAETMRREEMEEKVTACEEERESEWRNREGGNLESKHSRHDAKVESRAQSTMSEGGKLDSNYSRDTNVEEIACSEEGKVESKAESTVVEGGTEVESKYKRESRVEEIPSFDSPSLSLLGSESSGKDADGEARPPGSIKIRLKFLDETQRHVFAHLTEQVGSFKRQHFSIEMDANRRIRLIFNGQLLSQDTSTLAQYGLFDNCVVHCHVSQPLHNTPNANDTAAHDEEDAYVSRLLAPLLYGVLAVMWYLRFEYGHLFNAMSTIILLFLTALLLVSTYLLYVSNHIPNNTTTTTTTTTTTHSQPQSS